MALSLYCNIIILIDFGKKIGDCIKLLVILALPQYFFLLVIAWWQGSDSFLLAIDV